MSPICTRREFLWALGAAAALTLLRVCFGTASASDNRPNIVLIMADDMGYSDIGCYGGEGSWYYKEGRADTLTGTVLTAHNAISQSFFMGLLFLLSAYFTAASFDRKGSGPFLRDRLLRLGIPLLFFEFHIQPLLACWHRPPLRAVTQSTSSTPPLSFSLLWPQETCTCTPC